MSGQLTREGDGGRGARSAAMGLPAGEPRHAGVVDRLYARQGVRYLALVVAWLEFLA